VIQTYNYLNNDAYSTGSQALDAAIGTTRALSRGPVSGSWDGRIDGARRRRFAALGVTERPVEEEPSAGQGVSEGPRFYDYGPGSDFGALARLTHDGHDIAMFFYLGRQIYSLDGVRANHFLQQARVDLLFPLRRPLASVCQGNTSPRRSYYQDVAAPIKTYHYRSYART
jgi:hypothetical protein